MSSHQLIANELLAFIQHAIDTMDEVSIMQICKSNFKEDEISKGKQLIFQSLGKLDQMPTRRRDGTEKSIQDIISILKVTDPDDVPTFVAKELHRLPPVTFDHVDVTRLLKDILFLKTSLVEMQSKLEVSDNTISELRADIVLLRSAVSECRPLDTSNVNTRRGAQVAVARSFEEANTSPGAINSASDASRAAAADRLSTSGQVTTRMSTSPLKRAYADITAASKPAKSQDKQIGGKQNRECVHKDWKQRGSDEDGFITVEKRKKRKPTCRNQCGTAPTGPNFLLRPATPTTLLYVSRLHYTTKVEEIVEYIRVKSKFVMRVERLESRHNTNFNSFVVRVPTEHLSILMKEEFWPKCVVFRRFRGRIPDTERHTTPILRVK
ncbi:uncharacterized protein LOC111362504 [Spodoptera litura]|uniref:Uncharacterized protein LOC111362504 n=1 Tax=Spodoptera litura TaxID=69820 RepID=A0A9J7J363_SPOLT|nr:uncharacterized protein LOC111362504 [Spodoptera litura]